MGACGVVAATGIMLLTSAYRVARASAVTPFEYTGILWAPLWGFLFFSEVPRSTTVAGAAIIVLAGGPGGTSRRQTPGAVISGTLDATCLPVQLPACGRGFANASTATQLT